eukprot:s3931_g7.t1
MQLLKKNSRRFAADRLVLSRIRMVASHEVEMIESSQPEGTPPQTPTKASPKGSPKAPATPSKLMKKPSARASPMKVAKAKAPSKAKASSAAAKAKAKAKLPDKGPGVKKVSLKKPASALSSKGNDGKKDGKEKQKGRSMKEARGSGRCFLEVRDRACQG